MTRELAALSGFLEFVESHDDESRLLQMSPAGVLLADKNLGDGKDLFPAPGALSLAILAPSGDEDPEQLVLLEDSKARPLSEKAGQIRNVVVASDKSYAIYESNQESFRDLYRAELAAGTQRRLTEDGDGAFDPDLSPDNKYAVFVTTAGGQADLHVITADGKERRSLTETPANETSPSWSPDSASIAFSGDADGPERVFVIAAGGGAPKRLTTQSASDRHEVEPLWSPSSDMIAYLQHNSAGRSELWVATFPAGKSWRVSMEKGYADQAQWSPDGRFLWYVDNSENNLDIWVARSDGSERLRLTTSHNDEWLPRYRPGATPP